MKEEILKQIRDLAELLKQEKIPAIILAFSDDHFVNVKNCKNETVAQLLVNQIESSESMNEAFVKELEAITIKEMEAAQNEKAD